MKQLLTIITIFLFSIPAMADDTHDHAPLKQVEAEYVCMVNNKVFQTPQIAVEVEGSTYYGCCPMCKDKLTKSAAMRMAVDPVTGAEVDKAKAVIGALPDGSVFYFENKSTFEKYERYAEKFNDAHDHH